MGGRVKRRRRRRRRRRRKRSKMESRRLASVQDMVVLERGELSSEWRAMRGL
jgi:hypothetical protein